MRMVRIEGTKCVDPDTSPTEKKTRGNYYYVKTRTEVLCCEPFKDGFFLRKIQKMQFFMGNV
jgi:hypothetical protein